ncbi:MAG: hypothetical protein ACTSUD_01955 [Alphaproteobacteria bacterium]
MTAIAKAPTRNEQTRTNTGIRTTLWVLVAAGLALALTLKQIGFFEPAPGDTILTTIIGTVGSFALTMIVPAALFLLAYRTIPAFHAFVLSADPRFVTMTQAWRVVGFAFLALLGVGQLPGSFAWGAGVGDVLIGLAAPFIAIALIRRPDFIRTRRFAIFHWLGLFDFVAALTAGIVSSGAFPEISGPITVAPVAALPLYLIPGFVVPIFAMLHFTALLQARHAR